VAEGRRQRAGARSVPIAHERQTLPLIHTDNTDQDRVRDKRKFCAKDEGPQILSNPRAASDAEPISRILYGVAAADGHSSRPVITERLKRPTRKFGAPSRHAWKTACAVIHSFPIWSCSVWGLPCVTHYCGTGALLPHLFTLTATVEHLRLCGLALTLPSRPAQKRIGFHRFTYVRRYIFCCTGRRATPVPRRNAILKDPPGRYPAHCSVEFGLSSLWIAQPGKPGVHEPDSDHPVRHQLPIL